MSAKLIVSYDGTENDDDALALARLLAKAGATLALAYVRHVREFDEHREAIAQHDAERRLEQGAARLGDPAIPRHIVFSPSTGEGLERLAQEEGASVIVFGSDYRTAPGHAEPGGAAQQLLEGATVAVAVAAAGLRIDADAAIRSIAVAAPDDDDAPLQTADSLAARLGATVVPADGEARSDVIVVGSQSTAPEGRIALSGTSRALLNTALGSVLVLPRGKPVQF